MDFHGDNFPTFYFLFFCDIRDKEIVEEHYTQHNNRLMSMMNPCKKYVRVHNPLRIASASTLSAPPAPSRCRPLRKRPGCTRCRTHCISFTAATATSAPNCIIMRSDVLNEIDNLFSGLPLPEVELKDECDEKVNSKRASDLHVGEFLPPCSIHTCTSEKTLGPSRKPSMGA